jgi:hypothetical protein
MKRSAQVALLLGGLTTAGIGAVAISAPQRDCVAPTNPAGAAVPPPAANPTGSAMAPNRAPGLPGADAKALLRPGAQTPEPCSRSRRWFSRSGNYYHWNDYYHSRTTWGWPSGRRSTGTGVSTSTSLAASRVSRTSTTTARGGFGSTGHSFGRSSS